MSWGWPRGRDRFAVVVAGATVVVAFVLFLNPAVLEDEVSAIARWRFETATAALMVALGLLLMARRPGLAYLLLAASSMGVSGAIEGAYHASSSFAQFADGPTRGNPAYGLIVLAVLARTAVPAAILTLYATAPERRLGRWVAVVGWGITIASVAGAFLRLARELYETTPFAMPWWFNDLSYQLDEPIPLLTLGLIGALGSIRAAALVHVPARASVPGAAAEPAGAGPDRLLLATTAMAAVLWVPATLAFLNRPLSIDGAESTSKEIFVPILAALIGVVAARWSRIAAWLAIAVAFESIAYLVFARGAADYLALVLSLPIGTDVPIPPTFLSMVAASILVVVFAFSAVSIALRDALASAPTEASATATPDPWADRRWAVRGAAVGLVFVGWFFGGAFLGSGLPAMLGAALLPIYAIPFVLGMGAWRRLVPAVAEAERVATSPFRPLRYLETVVFEAVTTRAEHQRRAVDAERERLTSELHEVQESIRRLLSDGRLVLEVAPASGSLGVAPRPPSTLRRPSDREIDVIDLLVAGASNEEIARELVLSLKTVETHLRRLFGRYDLTNRTELAVLAVREGWVDAP